MVLSRSHDERPAACSMATDSSRKNNALGIPHRLFVGRSREDILSTGMTARVSFLRPKQTIGRSGRKHLTILILRYASCDGHLPHRPNHRQNSPSSHRSTPVFSTPSACSNPWGNCAVKRGMSRTSCPIPRHAMPGLCKYPRRNVRPFIVVLSQSLRFFVRGRPRPFCRRRGWRGIGGW